MPHLAYIDPDEEIISIIGRLRKATESEVFFVAPKRSILLQSLVNLRLLDRESKKLGKTIALVTQDESGQALAEKAGIRVERSLEQVQQEDAPVSTPSLPARLANQSNAISTDDRMSEDMPLPHSETIGSSNFFSGGGTSSPAFDTTSFDTASTPTKSVSPSANAVPSSRVLPVRDRTPKRLTMLNSKRGENIPSLSQLQTAPSVTAPLEKKSSEELASVLPSFSSGSDVKRTRSSGQEMPVSPSRNPLPPGGRTSTPDGAPISFLFPSQPRMEAASVPSQKSVVQPQTALPSQKETSDGNRMSMFFQKSVPTDSPVPSPSKPIPNHVSHRLAWKVLAVFAGVSLFAVLIVGAYVFLPRADVKIFAASRAADGVEVEIAARSDQESADPDRRLIPLRMIELEKELSQSYPATGTAGKSDSRARGIITIINAFGSEAQGLVATTRFETSDGKIFRLVKGVTIPGMKDQGGEKVPGIVEAEVVADTPGDSSNIDPTTFTIPGFKGSAKFDGFSAKSEQKFAGGGSDATSATVTDDDIEKAKSDAESKLSEALQEVLSSELSEGEKLLPDAMEENIESENASPGLGAVVSSFDYRIRVKVRALVFSERDAQGIARSALGVGNDVDVTLEYGSIQPDFSVPSLVVKMHAAPASGNTLNIEDIQKNLLGKNVSEIQGILARYPDIQKIEVSFWPEFMTNRIPTRPSRVFISVEPMSLEHNVSNDSKGQ